ncbi:type IV pilin protein [Hydrogenophaga sp. ZJX-1]|uniref:type IV pilin protein n=1 Tax=Hydrogenophaga sp. ZJX-1 TaxID=3404778 RepID=UPI003B283541
MTSVKTSLISSVGRRHKGFTLIELMIVVAVVAILSAIAIPSYDAYIRRTHRANAKSALMQVAQWMERAATAQGSYPLTAAVPAGLLNVEGNRYALTVVSANGTSYTLTATTQGPQASDECGNFTLTQAGTRAVTGSLPVDECWGR